MKKEHLLILPVLFAIFSGAANASEGLYCGDGILNEPQEQCDDGNYTNRDGCSAYCELEDITPAQVISSSIADAQENVSNLTNQIILTFDDRVTLEGLEGHVTFKEFNEEKEFEMNLSADKLKLTVKFLEPLVGEQQYAVILEGFDDEVGNRNFDRYVTTFFTGDHIDIVPPNPKAKPEGGQYSIAQSVSLKAYEGELTFSDAYLDEGAVIYYTTNGAFPTEDSLVYEKPFSIKTNTTVKYFAVDKDGNASDVEVDVYSFACADKPNAKEATKYPECKVLECNYGFILKSNVCVLRLGDQDADDYITEAIQAPLFGSDTPMTVSTKPSLYITPEHDGVLPRPIIFKDLEGGTVIEFERDTHIKRSDGSDFTGYIKPPNNLWTKSFPINFGFSFKSIFQFVPVDEGDLKFDPMVKITIPFSDRYDAGEPITVFIYDQVSEEYTEYNKNLVTVYDDGENSTVSILSDTTGIFFIAQPGNNYNALVFEDTVDHWAQNFIEQLYRWGHVQGRSKGVFAPNDILTRAEFTKIALNAIGEEVNPLEIVDDSPFLDVPIYAWYAPYITRAKALGLINGYPDATFRPDQPISRIEAVKLLVAAFDFDLDSVQGRTDQFQDIQQNEWYFPYLNYAHQNELVDGVREDETGRFVFDWFGPTNSMTRAEMAKMAVRAIEHAEEK